MLAKSGIVGLFEWFKILVEDQKWFSGFVDEWGEVFWFKEIFLVHENVKVWNSGNKVGFILKN